MKKINLFIISLTFFSFLIFFIGSYFFYDSTKLLNDIENTYIDPTVFPKVVFEEWEKNSEQENINVSLKSAYNINYTYFPSNFKNSIKEYTNALNIFLSSKEIQNKIDNLSIEFYEEKNDVRWKMKDQTLKLFWVKNMEVDECSAVWIHEFAHFIDLYYLEKKVFSDLSDYFYNISWESTKVLKSWQNQSDFVSGYAMTNKYEDFAETFTYFILHNTSFLEKTKDSDILKNKYDFFTKYLFREKSFEWSSFSTDEKILKYYRDITKINFSLEIFLQFLKKSI